MILYRYFESCPFALSCNFILTEPVKIKLHSCATFSLKFMSHNLQCGLWAMTLWSTHKTVKFQITRNIAIFGMMCCVCVCYRWSILCDMLCTYCEIPTQIILAKACIFCAGYCAILNSCYFRQTENKYMYIKLQRLPISWNKIWAIE